MDDFARILSNKADNDTGPHLGLLEDDTTCTGGLAILGQVDPSYIVDFYCNCREM